MVWNIICVLLNFGLSVYFFNDAKVQFKNSNNRAGKVSSAIGILNAIAVVLNIASIMLKVVA